MVNVDLSEKEVYIANARPMGIWYISPAEKYAKVWTHTVNTIHIADIFRKALDESFELIGPSTFFLCLPWIVINPQFLYENSKNIRNYIIKCRKEQLSLEFRTENDEILDQTSHRMIRWWQMRDGWIKVRELFKNCAFAELNSKKIDDLIAPSWKSGIFTVPKRYTYNLNEWKQYIQMLNDLLVLENNVNSFLCNEKIRLHPNIKHLPNLKHFEDLNIHQNSQFSSMKIERDFSKHFLKWKKSRDRRSRQTQ